MRLQARLRLAFSRLNRLPPLQAASAMLCTFLASAFAGAGLALAIALFSPGSSIFLFR